jgi:uncharacterized protein YdeI (YjbR/CyaY-like superfamily)
MELKQALYFKNNQEWRRWLEQNHSKEEEVWLIHYKKHSGKTSVSPSGAVEEALCFGWIDSKMKSIDEERYILKYSPRKAKSPWSNSNKERAEELIKLGRMTGAGLAKIETAKKNGYWDSAYTSRKKEKLPSDLRKALLEEPNAWLNFKSFANSYRNMYIGWVTSAKTEATRQRRIGEVVKRSLVNKKPGID